MYHWTQYHPLCFLQITQDQLLTAPVKKTAARKSWMDPYIVLYLWLVNLPPLTVSPPPSEILMRPRPKRKGNQWFFIIPKIIRPTISGEGEGWLIRQNEWSCTPIGNTPAVPTRFTCDFRPLGVPRFRTWKSHHFQAPAVKTLQEYLLQMLGITIKILPNASLMVIYHGRN